MDPDQNALHCLNVFGDVRFKKAVLWVAWLSLLAGCNAKEPDAPIPATIHDEFPVDAVFGLRVPQHGPVPELEDWADNPY